MGSLVETPSVSSDEVRDQIDVMLVALQSSRVALVSTIMRLRYPPYAGHHRVIRHAVIAFVRLQRLSEAAAELLDVNADFSKSDEELGSLL